ncbi:hypothetical protein V1511DRAFT_509307 [Dipodascopsis uninucleata]
MSVCFHFSFAVTSDGYFLHNGKQISATGIPVLLADAINKQKLGSMNSISIMPSGAWIVCFKNNGPDNNAYLGDNLPQPLSEYLAQSAAENVSNPLNWVQMGPDDQYFARRKQNMTWRLNSHLQGSMEKLQALGLQSHLEQIVFGPENRAIFMFSNGSFLWDAPLEDEAEEILQSCYATGADLEAAAYSFMEPGAFFFFWGHCIANFRMEEEHHEIVKKLILEAEITRFQMKLLMNSMISGAAMASQMRLQQLRQSMADYEQQRLQQQGQQDFNIAGLVAWQGGTNAVQVAKIVDQFTASTNLAEEKAEEIFVHGSSPHLP